jgi:lipoprotein-anchoring transpeptidase ErfK/SrfK
MTRKQQLPPPTRQPQRIVRRPPADPAAAPTEMWVRAPGRSRPFSPRAFLLAGCLGLLLSGLLLFATMGLLFYRSNLIFPGVRVLGMHVGLQTTAEAAAMLQARWDRQVLALEDGVGGRWPAGLAELGMTLDARATARGAYRLGRTPESLAALVGAGFEAAPVWGFDPAVAEARLHALAGQIDRAPVNAGVRVTDGQAQITPPAAGRTLDVTATLAQLTADPAAALQHGRLPLVVRPIAPVVTDVSGPAAEAQRLLALTVTVRAYDPIDDSAVVWTLPPDVWGQWLTLAVDPAAPKPLRWELAAQPAAAYFTAQAAVLGEARTVRAEELVTAVTDAVASQTPTVSARIYHRPRRHAVQPGESFASIGRDYGIPYPWLQQANPGVTTLSVGQVIDVPSPDDLLPLPVVENKRVVVSIAAQRVWVYEDGQLKWEWPASTGIDSSPTSPGVFQIQSHELNAYAGNWDLWMPHFMGIYRPVPASDFMNGFHGFPTRGGATLLWTGDLGRKVTYGCILLSSENAALLYAWAEDGVVVDVRP